MSVTFKQAREAMQNLFATNWELQSPIFNDGQAPQIQWQALDEVGDNEPGKSSINATWVRFTILHGPSSQGTLAAAPNRLFKRTGTIIVNIFTPLSRSGGLDQAEDLATIIKNIYEGNSTGPNNCIWFRDVDIREIGPDSGWYQCNVNINFMYDELK